MATYGYCRVSGKGQIDGEGFARQHEAIAQKAQSAGWTLDMVVNEEGVTGELEGSARPAWAHLMSLVQSGDRVVVENLSRFARNLYIQEVMMNDLQKRGVELVSTMEDEVSSTDPSRVLVRQIFGAIHAYEKSLIVSKLRHARNTVKAREGRCEGRKPYGHRPGESATVQQMRALRSQGLSFATIAARLNADGLKPRAARHWSAASVCNIVARPEPCAAEPTGAAVASEVASALANLGMGSKQAKALADAIPAGSDFETGLRHCLSHR
jgi:DNA invertase Pin-like site-specific DNA recombinase